MRTKLHYLAITAAWASVAVIAYATLSRVAVVYDLYDTVAPIVAHPSVANFVHFEHVFAYAIVGLLFASVYPQRTILVCCMVFGGAVLLEVLQTLTPDRHGTIHDAVEKIAGGAVGIAFGRVASKMNSRLQRRKTGFPAS